MNALTDSLNEVVGELEAHLGNLDPPGLKVLVKRLIDRLRTVIDELSKAGYVTLNVRLSKLLGELLAAAEALLEALHVYLKSLKGTLEEKGRARGALDDAMSAVEAALGAIEAALGLGPNPGGTTP
ncbi:hypothetical protein [Xanthomonas hortorum]|uniref:hypothetical protein n=1 Tax=Xanthomonas hortorum TaxID=56454 RepID=UPI001592BA92|nr:hypothetical protein [Xanthomonas hortorum]NHF68423.1 hypothetical protein [Xanthomonas hortorum]